MPIPELAVSFDEKQVDAIFAEVARCHTPGAAVGIALHGKPLYRKAFGLASLELPLALSPSTRMRIASVSKHFACLAYLLLCEEAKATIDDPVGRHLPELHPSFHATTMRQLMAHTSGLRDAFDLSMQFNGTGVPLSSADLLHSYRQPIGINNPPDTVWQYNNGGYLMLGAAIERIADRPLEAVLRERIFEPVGMYDTLLRRFDTDFVSNSATLHTPCAGGEGYRKSYMGMALAGEGGIVSTVNDMLRWLAHMAKPAVGSADSWKAMTAPHTLRNGTSTGYGFGLRSGSYRGASTVEHSGLVMGGTAQMLKVAAADLDVVVVTNRQDLSAVDLTSRVLDTCLPHLGPLPERGHALIVGNYRSAATGRVIQLYGKNQRQAAAIDGGEMFLERFPDGKLRAFESAKLDIELLGDSAHPMSIRCNDFGNRDELARLSEPKRTAITAIAGRYRCASIGVEVMISAADEAPLLSTRGPFGAAEFRLECLADGIWRARSAGPLYVLGAILSFTASGDSFTFSSLRSTALVFRRIR